MPAVNAERLGRLARMLRVRQRLTQTSLSARAGVSRRAVSMLENGRAPNLRLSVVEGILATLGARLDLRILWNGPEMDRLQSVALGAHLCCRVCESIIARRARNEEAGRGGHPPRYTSGAPKSS